MLRILVMSLLAAAAVNVLADEPGHTGGWRFLPARAEVSPQSATRSENGIRSLMIRGNGSALADGKWTRRVDLPAGKFVSLSGKLRASNIEQLARNVVISLTWLDEKGGDVGNVEFAATTSPADASGWREVNSIYPVPDKAKQAQLDLRLRWTANGEIEFRDIKLAAAEAPPPRKVMIASVNHRPRGNKTAQQNLEEFAKMIDQAGEKKTDIVCLPEAITLVGRGADYIANIEPIPGPSTEFLGRSAVKNHCYIVAGLLEKDGDAAYNTAVLIDRNGKLVGKYRKICLPYPESNAGLAPGHEYPVFDTDFGKVGLMICWDVSYPQVARELAARGAEMILMPIWGGNETLCRARAIENQIPLIISSYDLRSAIYDQAGEPIAIAPSTADCVVTAELDLADCMNWKWLGHWRNRIWVEGPVRKDASETAVKTSKASE